MNKRESNITKNPFRTRKGIAMLSDYPLICQNIRLPELAPGLVPHQSRVSWLPRFQRAGPSTSLDKSAAKGYLNVGQYYHRTREVSN